MGALTLVRSYLAARWRFRRLRGSRLDRFQDERARAAIAFAREHSPFYRSLYARWDGRDWRTLPTIDKAAMMANFDGFTTRGLRKDAVMPRALAAERGEAVSSADGLTIGLSSGTSGHRGLFVLDERERMMWAGAILARMLPGVPRWGVRAAFFLRADNRLYQSVRSRWIRLRYWDVMTPLDEVVPQLREFQPDVVIGPPSLLGRLASVSGELRIQPRQVVSVAEVLDPGDAQAIEAAFGTPVGQVYQATEGLLAVTCPRGSLHLQEDLAAVQLEPLDDEGRMMPIVTDLWRRVQPILRYRLNDVLTLESTPCPCGSAFRVLQRIEGRADDLCALAAIGGGQRTVAPDVIRRMILLADDRIEDYRVVQDRPGSLQVHLLVAGEFVAVAESVRASAAAVAARYGCVPPELRFSATLPPEDGKRRRVRRVEVP